MRDKQLINWLLFVLICLIWGSSFILMKLGLKGISAYEVASIRIISGSIVLLPFAFKAYSRIIQGKLPLVALTGFVGTFIPAYLFCIAETKIDSAIAGILNALTPLFTIFIGVMIFKNKVSGTKWAGVFIGLIGLVLLMLSGNEPIASANTGYGLFVLAATVMYGTNVNLINRYLKSMSSIDIASLSFAFLLPPALIILYFAGYFERNFSDTEILASTVASVVLGLIGTALGTLLFYGLIKRAGPVFSSMVTYGIPFVALSWGLFAGELINTLQIICLCIILGGVYLSNK
jgi:drug/metabolite transporter (DMT)-like permease